MAQRVSGLTGATLEHAPAVCGTCVWWQSRERRARRRRSAGSRRSRTSSGRWGALYHDDDGRLLGSMQYGPAQLFPRAAELPAGPPSDDSVLVTCVYLVANALPVGRAVALPRGDRRSARQGREGARGVRLPLPRGRVGLRALPRPPHRLPARLPRRLRLPDRADGGPRRAGAARARRPRAGRGRQGARRCCGWSRRRSPRRRCRNARRPVTQSSFASARSTRISAIASDDVAAGEGAFWTWSTRAVSANRKSSASNPSSCNA